MNTRESLIAAIAVAAMAGGSWFGFHRAIAAADEAEKPAATQPAGEGDEAKGTAAVKTAVIRDGAISQTITAFGSVTAQPGSVSVFSVAFECRVRHILVTPGQQIDKDTPLIEVEPSPAAKLQLLEARNAVEAA